MLLTTKVALVLLGRKMSLEVRREEEVKPVEKINTAGGGVPGGGEEHGRSVVLPCLGGLLHTSLRLFSGAHHLLTQADVKLILRDPCPALRWRKRCCSFW